MALIRKIRDTGVTVFLIEHDMKVVKGVSTVLVLENGQKIAEGTCRSAGQPAPSRSTWAARKTNERFNRNVRDSPASSSCSTSVMCTLTTGMCTR